MFLNIKFWVIGCGMVMVLVCEWIFGWIWKKENRLFRYSVCLVICEKLISRFFSSWCRCRKLLVRKVRLLMEKLLCMVC